MAIIIPDGFQVTAGAPIDSRTNVATLLERDALDPVVLYEGLLCYVKEDGKLYKWTVDETWEEFEAGGGGSGQGIGSVDILYAQTFEESEDPEAEFYNAVNCSLETTNPINGTKSLKIAYDATLDEGELVIEVPVSPAFRNRKIKATVETRTATLGGAIQFTATDNGVGGQIFEKFIGIGTSPTKTTVYGNIPVGCTSFFLRFAVVGTIADGNVWIDDIQIEQTDTNLSIGDGNPYNDAHIEYNRGDLFNPRVRYNALTTRWEYSHDGSAYHEFSQAKNDSDIMFYDGFEDSLGYYDQTGLELSTTAGEVLNGKQTAKLIHQPFSTYEVGRAFPFAKKFIGRNVTALVDCVSEAEAGNVIFKVLDNNTLDVLAEEQLQFDPDVSFQNRISFDVPDTGSIRYIIEALPQAGLPVTLLDDVVFVLTEALSTETALVQEEDSEVSTETFNGYGSTSTLIHRFSDISVKGSGISVNDDAALGTLFVVQEAGIIDIAFSEATSANTNRAESQILINGSVVSVVNERVTTASTATKWTHVSFTGILSVGDVIAFAVPSSTEMNSNAVRLRITKQGSLKQVNVNKNQKIKIPTSEVHFRGQTTRGSEYGGLSLIFPDITKLSGADFTVGSDSSGSYVEFKKSGMAFATASVSTGVANQWISIYHNDFTQNYGGLDASNVIGTWVSASYSAKVKVGDRFYAVASTGALGSSNAQHFLVSFMSDEVQVSVSNTLPQFSESDLVVKCAGNGEEVITVSTEDIPFTTVEDSGGYWNGTQFTVPEDGTYNLTGAVQVTTAAQRAIDLHIGGVLTKRLSDSLNASLVVFSFTDTFTAGQVLSFRMPGNGGTLQNNPEYHYLNITKVGKPNVTGVDVTPFLNIPYPEAGMQSTYRYVAGTFTNSIVSGAGAGNEQGNGLYSYDSATGIYKALKKISVTVTHTCGAVSASLTYARVYIRGELRGNDVTAATVNSFASATASSVLEIGDEFYCFTAGTGGGNNHTISISAISIEMPDTVITPIESFSTDTATLTWRSSSEYTLATLQNAAVGDFITFQYTGGSNTITQTTSAPSQSVDDMNTNGIYMYARPYTGASNGTTNISRIAIQIGKGFKGVEKFLYKSDATTSPRISGDLDYVVPSASQARGLRFKDYDATTGVLVLDSGYQENSSGNTQASFRFSDGAASENYGYLVINASKSPVLAGIPTFRPVACSYTSDSGQAIGTSETLLKFEDKVFDTHGMYNTGSGIATIPEDGEYEVEASWLQGSATLTTSQSAGGYLYVNGVQAKLGRVNGNGAAQHFNLTVRRNLRLKRGDTIYFRALSSIATTMNTTAAWNSMSITKVK